MKAAVLHSIPGELAVADVAIDKPQRGEVLIRTAAAGLLPQRPPLHGGQVPLSRARRCPATSRPVSSRRSART